MGINKITAGVLTALMIVGFCVVAPTAVHATTYSFLEDEAEPQVNIAFTLTTAATGSLTIVFDYQNDKNFYALDFTPKGGELRCVVDGVPQRLSSTPVTWKPSSTVTIKRRPWLIQVVIDNQAVLTAYDATFDAGKIGAATDKGWNWKDVRVQPVEELYFADDFTRTAAEENQWKAASGNWELTASSDKITTKNADMSANPFSYGVDATKAPALAQVGRWFWDNYDAQVSVRPATPGTIGLAVYVQDAKNYLALLWSATEGPAARQLVRVVDGKSTVLAKAPGAFLPRQWYRLAVRTSPGYVETFIDGAPGLEARDGWFGQGGIALLAQDGVTANFDDVHVRSYSYYRQDFLASGDSWAGSAWMPAGGTWRAEDGVVTSSSKTGEATPRMFVTGRSDWNGYEISAGAHIEQTGAGGLVAGYRDANNYAVFRWAGAGSSVPYHGRQQLVRFSDGKPTIISDEPATVFSIAGADGFVRVKVSFEAGLLTVRAGEQIIAQVADETLTSGQAALWSDGAAATSFRDVVVFFPPEPEKPKVAPKMETDTLMAGWASPKGEWPPSLGIDGIEYWNTGEFFGDASIEYSWRRVAYSRGKMDIALQAQRGEFATATVLRCEGDGDNGLKLSLLKGPAVLRQTTFDWKQLGNDSLQNESGVEAPVPLRVDLSGRALLASVGGKPALSFLGESRRPAEAGTALGVRTSGFALRPKELRAFSANRNDYTFTEAPTDWYAPQGDWNVTSRWPCTSDWSFFAGIGLNPVLWSKRIYSGAIVVEMYAHNQMDLPKEIGYSAPGNLNITIGGDGKNPSSGYSFVVGGRNYTHNYIFKGERMVAENQVQGSRFPLAVNHNPQWHNRWAYIRAELRHAQKDGRDGIMVSLSMDEEPLLEYFDAEPLPAIKQGGHVAFWTVDGTLMIARAKIESANIGPRIMPAGLTYAAMQPDIKTVGDTLVPRALLADSTPSAVVRSTPGRADKPGEVVWSITNPTTGGLFAVQLLKPDTGAANSIPLKVTQNTKIGLDIALPPDVNIDFYATIRGVRHLVTLAGNQKPDARVKLLGTTANQPGAGTASDWRHISFDIGAALKKLYPDANSWEIEELTLGALHGDEYRWVGFGGNPMGASYRLRGARLSDQ